MVQSVPINARQKTATFNDAFGNGTAARLQAVTLGTEDISHGDIWIGFRLGAEWENMD